MRLGEQCAIGSTGGEHEPRERAQRLVDVARHYFFPGPAREGLAARLALIRTEPLPSPPGE